VLPGSHEALPPVQAKIADIKEKYISNTYETTNPVVSRYFCLLLSNEMHDFPSAHKF
jgi:hypothetical protein